MRRCECGEPLVDGECPKCQALRKPAARGRLHQEGVREPRREVLISARDASRGMARAGVPAGSCEVPRYIWRGRRA